MIDIELNVQYFNGETLEPVEYTRIIETPLRTMDAAKLEARQLIDSAMKDAYDDGAMMDTFYYEYDFLVPGELFRTLVEEN